MAKKSELHAVEDPEQIPEAVTEEMLNTDEAARLLPGCGAIFQGEERDRVRGSIDTS